MRDLAELEAERHDFLLEAEGLWYNRSKWERLAPTQQEEIIAKLGDIAQYATCGLRKSMPQFAKRQRWDMLFMKYTQVANSLICRFDNRRSQAVAEDDLPMTPAVRSTTLIADNDAIFNARQPMNRSHSPNGGCLTTIPVEHRTIPTRPVLDMSAPGRQLTDRIFFNERGEPPAGEYYLLNQYGYPSIDKLAGRYLTLFKDMNGMVHELFDQAIHLTVRLEHKITHEITVKAFDHPVDWNNPQEVHSKLKLAQQYVRRHAGSPYSRERYTEEEEVWLKNFVVARGHVSWKSVSSIMSGDWKMLWAAYQLNFPDTGRTEAGLWAKCGRGKFRMNLLHSEK